MRGSESAARGDEARSRRHLGRLAAAAAPAVAQGHDGEQRVAAAGEAGGGRAEAGGRMDPPDGALIDSVFGGELGDRDGAGHFASSARVAT